jgi:hypothetical protein
LLSDSGSLQRDAEVDSSASPLALRDARKRFADDRFPSGRPLLFENPLSLGIAVFYDRVAHAASAGAFLFSSPFPLPYKHRYALIMSYSRNILDRKVGRNAQLFACAIAQLDTPRARFPYLRILVSLIEKAHPEWQHAPGKQRQVARLARRMSDGALCPDEVTEVMKARERES